MKKICGDEIYVQNNFVDDVINNPENFTYEQIMFISNFTLYNYDLFDYIVLNYPFVKGAEVFKTELTSYGIYDEYLRSVMEDGDILLQSSFAFYIEPSLRDTVIGDELEFVDKIKNDDDCPFEYKICLLTSLAIHKNHGDIINVIKNSIVNIVNTDERINNDFSKEEKEQILNKYLSVIDENTISDAKKLSNKM